MCMLNPQLVGKWSLLAYIDQASLAHEIVCQVLIHGAVEHLVLSEYVMVVGVTVESVRRKHMVSIRICSRQERLSFHVQLFT